MNLAIIALEFCGLISLALSMQSNHRRVFDGRGHHQSGVKFRIAGAVLLITAFTFSIIMYGWEHSLVAFFCQFSVGAVAVALLLAWIPGTLPWVGAVVLVIGLSGAISGFYQAL